MPVSGKWLILMAFFVLLAGQPLHAGILLGSVDTSDQEMLLGYSNAPRLTLSTMGICSPRDIGLNWTGHLPPTTSTALQGMPALQLDRAVENSDLKPGGNDGLAVPLGFTILFGALRLFFGSKAYREFYSQTMGPLNQY